MVAESIEYEFKYELTRNSYSELLKVLNAQDSVCRQQQLENYYFDTPKLNLHRERYRTRVRIIDGKTANLTVKHPVKVERKETRAKVRGEVEASLPIDLAKSLVNGDILISEVLGLDPLDMLREAFKVKHIESLKCLGGISTLRTEATLQGDFKLEVDRSEIFSDIIYDAEVEVSSTDDEWVDEQAQKFFYQHKIEFTPNKTSKASRFIKGIR